jgi:hypothetical protein
MRATAAVKAMAGVAHPRHGRRACGLGVNPEASGCRARPRNKRPLRPVVVSTASGLGRHRAGWPGPSCGGAEGWPSPAGRAGRSFRRPRRPSESRRSVRRWRACPGRAGCPGGWWRPAGDQAERRPGCCDGAPQAERLVALGALGEHVHHDRQRRGGGRSLSCRSACGGGTCVAGAARSISAARRRILPARRVNTSERAKARHGWTTSRWSTRCLEVITTRSRGGPSPACSP